MILVSWKQYCYNHKGPIELYRRLNEHIYALITSDLMGRNWEILHKHSMDLVYDIFQDIVLECIDTHAPMLHRQVKNIYKARHVKREPLPLKDC